MEYFQNILVCVDVDAESPAALNRAVDLARRGPAKLRLFTAVEATPWWAEALLPGVARHWYASYFEQAKEKLKQLAGGLAERGIEVTHAARVGRPWLEVIREVLRGGHDLVLKDVDPGEEGEALLGGHTDMHILRTCPCPVWLVKKKVARFRRIAAAVDVVPGDDKRNAFNEKILRLAIALAEVEDCELYVVRAWSMYTESVLRYKMVPEEIHQLREAKRQRLGQELERFLAKFPLAPSRTHLHVVEGEPEVVIPLVAEREHEDLVVMGTLARTGVPGLLIGNTAEKILRRINCSVLAIKPDEFVSPVTLDEH